MPQRMLKALRDFFAGNDSVRRVADDPALSAELLLLFRVMLADGQVQDEEMTVFRHICETAFGIGADDINQVIDYLQDVGYETTGHQAIAVFEALPEERRAKLIGHMTEIAGADERFMPAERDLIRRVAERLGVGSVG